MNVDELDSLAPLATYNEGPYFESCNVSLFHLATTHLLIELCSGSVSLKYGHVVVSNLLAQLLLFRDNVMLIYAYLNNWTIRVSVSNWRMKNNL